MPRACVVVRMFDDAHMICSCIVHLAKTKHLLNRYTRRLRKCIARLVNLPPLNEITCTSQDMSTAVSVHTFSFVTIIIIQKSVLLSVPMVLASLYKHYIAEWGTAPADKCPVGND